MLLQGENTLHALLMLLYSIHWEHFLSREYLNSQQFEHKLTINLRIVTSSIDLLSCILLFLKKKLVNSFTSNMKSKFITFLLFSSIVIVSVYSQDITDQMEEESIESDASLIPISRHERSVGGGGKGGAAAGGKVCFTSTSSS